MKRAWAGSVEDIYLPRIQIVLKLLFVFERILIQGGALNGRIILKIGTGTKTDAEIQKQRSPVPKNTDKQTDSSTPKKQKLLDS